jgi:transposase
MDRNQLESLEKGQLIEIILLLTEELKALTVTVSELEGRLNTNSGNSSKPPSQDGFDKPSPKSLRTKSGKKPGGQKGHKGSGLKLQREPDEVKEHKPEYCHNCGMDLTGISCVCVKTSNVIDFKVEVRIISHRQMKGNCPACGTVNIGEMPKEAGHSMIYGSGLRAFVVLLSNFACVGMKKISKILSDVFGISLSTGTIANMNAGFAEKSVPILQEIQTKMLRSPLLHKDESGMNMNGKNWWLHTSSTPELTYITAHPKRGKEGIDDNGVLDEYTGVLVHDFWASYFKYEKCLHAMCNAHLLRELNWVTDNTLQKWASRMSALLCEMKRIKEDYLEAEKFELSRYYVNKFAKEYIDIITLGETEAPYNPTSRKQTKPRNLLERFINYQAEITLFAHNFNVPFDNNLAERDIRNAKVKQKVSGAFRSDTGIGNFAKASSIIGTATKQKLSVFDTIKGIINGTVSSLFHKKLSATEQ